MGPFIALGLGAVAAYFFGGKALDKMAVSVAAGIGHFVLDVFIQIIGGVLTFFLGLVTYFVTFVLELNLKILDESGAAYNFISVGWTIMRDIANLGFVLFIIIIALATIVRFRDYEAKQLLPRLIGAAILVNFSLAIPSIFINFSNVLTTYFLDKVGLEQSNDETIGLGSSAKFALNLDAIANPTGIMLPQEKIKEMLKVWAGEKTMLQVIAEFSQKIWGIMFLIVAIFIIGALGVLFLIRFIVLHFLLVLAPIVWLFWVIPGLSPQFGSWWKKFLQYTFFLPISIFFLYLTIAVGQKLHTITQQSANIKMDIFSAKGAGEGVRVMMQNLAASYVVLGFLVGSVIAGQKLSISGAESAMKTGKSFIDKGKTWAKKGAKAGGDAAMRSQPAQKLANSLKKSGGLRGIAGYAIQGNINKRLAEKLKKEEGKLKIRTNNDEEVGHYTSLTGNSAGYAFVADGGKQRVEDLEKENKKVTEKHAAKREAEKALTRAEENKNVSENILRKEYGKNATEGQLRDFDLYRSFISGENRKDFGDRSEEEKNFMAATLGDERIQQHKDAIASATTKTERDEIEEKLNNDMESKAKTDFMEEMNRANLGKEYKEFNKSEDQLAKAAESLDEAIEAEEKATKTRDKTQEGLNSWQNNVVGKLGDPTAAYLKQKNYDLSQTDLPGSRKAKTGKMPETSFDKIAKSFEKATERFEKTKLENDGIQNNPLLEREEKERSQQKFEVVERVFLKEQVQFKTYDENHKKEKKIRDAIGDKIKILKANGVSDEGIARDDEVKKAREDLTRLRREKLEITKKNPYLTTPAHVKGKKKDADDDEKEEKEKE